MLRRLFVLQILGYDDRIVLLRNARLAIDVDDMSGPVRLRLQVKTIVFVGRHDVRDASGDADPVSSKLVYLLGIVGEQPHRTDREARDHVCRNRVVPLIIAESECEVGVDRVEALVLQRVRPQLVDEADPPAFLPQVLEQAPRFPSDPRQRDPELVTAVAAQRAERVAREAL